VAPEFHVVIAFFPSGALAVGLAASMVTYLGGVTTFRLRHRLPLIPALAAGIVVGVITLLFAVVYWIFVAMHAGGSTGGSRGGGY